MEYESYSLYIRQDGQSMFQIPLIMDIPYKPYVPLWPILCRIEGPSILSGVNISGTTLGPVDWSTKRE